MLATPTDKPLQVRDAAIAVVRNFDDEVAVGQFLMMMMIVPPLEMAPSRRVPKSVGSIAISHL